MRNLVRLEDSAEADALHVHMMTEFGATCSNLREVMVPGQGMRIEVLVPLQTGHHVSGRGLGQGNTIPPGIYEVLGLECGMRSRWSRLRPLDGGDPISFCVGYSGSTTVDWRGARRVQ